MHRMHDDASQIRDATRLTLRGYERINRAPFVTRKCIARGVKNTKKLLVFNEFQSDKTLALQAVEPA